MTYILGIDPGSRRAGWALYDTVTDRILDSGAQEFKGEVDLRLEAVPSWLQTLLPKGNSVDLVAYEKMFSTGHNSDAPLAVFAWMVRRAARRNGVRCVAIPHAKAYKLACGKGNAKKAEVKEFLEKHFGEELPCTDVSDAVAVAVAAGKEEGQP